MTIKFFTEAVAAPEKVKGNRWRVIAARPGQGSSGFYSESVLKEYGPAALHPGAQSFITHDDKRDPRDMIGYFPKGGYWDEEEKALVAELEVYSHWSDFVSEVGPRAGMSIYMAGESDEDGNVTRLTPHVYNGCDLVARPGLAGSGLDEQLIESARTRATEKLSGKDVNGMEKEIGELTEKVGVLSDLITQFVAGLGKEDGSETNAVEAYDSALAQIAEADLLPSQNESLRALAREGRDITEDITRAVAVKKELLDQVEKAKEAQETEVHVVTGVKVESALDLGKVFG